MRMTEWWRRRWHETRGLGEIVGGIGGFLLLVFVLTGGISAFRLWQTHQVLNQAATVALRSEEQQGCWTSATTQAVDQTLQQAGLNPAGLQTIARQTTFNNNGGPFQYGQPIKVNFAYTTSTDFLFGGLGQWTEHAGQSGSSFYVPASQGTASACAPLTGGAVTTGVGTASAGPVISNVVFSNWSATGATVTITGSDFGSMPTLTSANGGENNSTMLALHYAGAEMGYGNDSDGLTYASWSPTQIVLQYPGTWATPAPYGSIPLNGGTMSIDVWNGQQEATTSVTVPTNPTPTSLALTASATSTETGEPVTLTATTGSAGGSAINIINVTTGRVIRSCENASSCSATVTDYTQNSPLSESFAANVGTAGSTTGTVSANPVSVTWNPVAQITASRWWIDPPGTTVGSAGVTLPTGDTSDLWWAFQVQGAASSFQGWAQNWDTPVTAGATYAPTATRGWLGVGDLLPGAHHVVLTFYFSNGAIQELASPPVTMVTPSVTLAANPTNPSVGHSSTLSATSDFNVTGSGLAINIEDTTTGNVVAECTTGTTCSIPQTENGPTTQHYEADIGPANATVSAPGVVATSSQVAVQWNWSITLTANTTNTAPGDSVVLTARASAAIDPPYYINVVDETTNQVVGWCAWNSSCSVTVSQSDATTQNYVADIGSWYALPAQAAVTSSPVSVTWAWTLSLTTSTTHTGPNDNVLLTAQANGYVGSPDEIQIWDSTTNSQVNACYGTQCSVDVTQTQQTTQTYVARIVHVTNGHWASRWNGQFWQSYWVPGSTQVIESSNSVAVTWAWTVSLSASSATAGPGGTVVLSSTLNSSSYPNYVNIVDVTTGTVVQSCWDASSCTVSVSQNTETTQTYESDIGSYGALPANAVLSSSPATVTWSGWTVSLSANTTQTGPGNNVTLSATTNGSANWPYQLVIWDMTTNTEVTGSYGSSTSANVSQSQVTSQNYEAEIVNASQGYWQYEYANGYWQYVWVYPASAIVATSSQIRVNWAWTLTLSASNTTPAVGNNVLLTASPNSTTVNEYLNIWNTTTHQLVNACWYASSCSVYVSESSVQSDTFQADIGSYDAAPGSTASILSSNAVAVSWNEPLAVTLSASSTGPSIGQDTTLTATANQPIPAGDAINIVDTTTDQVVGITGGGTIAYAVVSENSQTSQTYEADIGPDNALPNQDTAAVSSPVTISWGSLASSLLPAGQAPMELYASAPGYTSTTASLSVPTGTAVTFTTTTWGYNPQQTLMYDNQQGGPWWTGNPQYTWVDETVTGPDGISYGYNSGYGMGTADFQVWNGAGQGSNIITVTWY